MKSATKSGINKISKTSHATSSSYHSIIEYLEKASQSGAEFYIQKRGFGKNLMSIRFDPSELRSNIGVSLARYLLNAEKLGDKIYIKKPNEGVKRVSFLGKPKSLSQLAARKFKARR